MKIKLATMALLSFAALTSAASQPNTRAADSLVLVAIRSASGNTVGSASQPWTTGIKMESWSGVGLDANGRVTSLSLQPNYGLATVATIPDAFCTLTALKSFGLSNSTVTSLPACMDTMATLQRLDINSNAGLEAIPTAITGMPQLTRLWWQNNGSTSAATNVRPNLSALTNLDTLTLSASDNNTTSAWPALPLGITSMTKLKYLYLGNQKITSLAGIGSLATLKILALNNMGLTSLPDEIGDLTSLTFLNLRNNAFTALPTSLSALTNLEDFRAQGNVLTSIPAYVWTWTKLTQLALEGSGTTQIVLPTEIGNLVNLTQLSLTNFRIQSLPASMAKLTKLTGLVLSKNWLSEFPGYWANSTIASIDLSNNLLATLPADYKQETMCGATTCALELNLGYNYLTTAAQGMQADRFADITDGLTITTTNQNAVSILDQALTTYAPSISAASKPYDATAVAVVLDTLQNADNNGYPVYLECPGTFASINVDANIAVTFGDKSKCVLTGPGKNTADISTPLSNFDFNTLTLTGNITKAPLVVTALAEEITVGQTPKLAYTVTGLYGTDKLTGALAVNGTKVGSYDITLGTLKEGDNYAIGAFNSAKLTIKATTSVIQATQAQATQAQGTQWFQAIQASHGTAVLRSLDGRTIWSASLPCSATEVRAQLQTGSNMAILQVGKQNWLVK